MSSATLFDLSVTVALVSGTAAGLLALLSWEIFRGTPFGRALAVLSIAMSVFTLYHGTLLVFGRESMLVTEVIQSATYTGMAAFIATVIRSQREYQGDTATADR